MPRLLGSHGAGALADTVCRLTPSVPSPDGSPSLLNSSRCAPPFCWSTWRWLVPPKIHLTPVPVMLGGLGTPKIARASSEHGLVELTLGSRASLAPPKTDDPLSTLMKTLSK